MDKIIKVKLLWKWCWEGILLSTHTKISYLRLRNVTRLGFIVFLQSFPLLALSQAQGLSHSTCIRKIKEGNGTWDKEMYVQGRKDRRTSILQPHYEPSTRQHLISASKPDSLQFLAFSLTSRATKVRITKDRYGRADFVTHRF
jgi:hypothetical protein